MGGMQLEHENNSLAIRWCTKLNMWSSLASQPDPTRIEGSGWLARLCGVQSHNLLVLCNNLILFHKLLQF